MLSLKRNARNALCLIGLFLVSRFALSAEITLKLGHVANERSTWHLASLKFAEEVKTLTKGAIEVNVFPNESLGKEMDLLKEMQWGSADMTIIGESLQNWAPKASLLALPYAFQSIEAMDSVVNGRLGQQIKAEIIAKAKVIPLAYFARGPRYLTSQTPIKTVSDVRGLRMRVPKVPVFVQYWRSVGAHPAPMALAEVFSSLQTGLIDAQENPLALIASAKLFEVQKYINRTEHVRSWIYLTIGERSYQKLSNEQRKALEEAAQRVQAYERTLMLADEEKLEAGLKAKGMTFVDTDQSGFSKNAKEIVLAAAREEMKPMIEEIYAHASRPF